MKPSISTPLPTFKKIYQIHPKENLTPKISVVVSLYNYRDFIIETLETIFAQSFKPFELVVVDDCSTDLGHQLVHSWLENHSSSFAGVTLLRHDFNAGLAATRNTGFKNASAAWVWVQDADNPLVPKALELAYCIAEFVEEKVAVVHPLLLTRPAGVSSQIFQGEGRPWQRKIFERSNAVDAMALVRRMAWKQVGGYTHIQGGWEDYDFWCALIDNGWTGVQCPEVLGFYTHHKNSMTSLTALPNVQRLEALLKERHPWLKCEGNTSYL